MGNFEFNMSPEERIDKRKTDINNDQIAGQDDYKKFGEEDRDGWELAPEAEEEANKRQVIRRFLNKESTQN